MNRLTKLVSRFALTFALMLPVTASAVLTTVAPRTPTGAQELVDSDPQKCLGTLDRAAVARTFDACFNAIERSREANSQPQWWLLMGGVFLGVLLTLFVLIWKRVISVGIVALLLLSSSANAAQERVWQNSVNVTNPGATATDIANYHEWFIMETATGGAGLTWLNQAGSGTTPSGGWTVSGSWDGSSATCTVAACPASNCMDGVNRWHPNTFTTADFVHAAEGSYHSWIALQSAHNANYKVILNLNSATANTIDVVFGYGAFSGGTTTGCKNRPTIAKQFGGVSPGGTSLLALVLDDGSTGAHKDHGLLSTTGDFWIYQSKNGSNIFWSAIGAVEMLEMDGTSGNPASTYPLWTTGRYSATSPVLASSNTTPINQAGAAMSRFGIMATNVFIAAPSFGYTQMTSGTTGTGTVTNVSESNPAGGAWMWESRVYVWDSTAVRNDYYGRIPDLFYAHVARADGDVTPSGGGTLDYTVVGDFWAPWGGTAHPSLLWAGDNDLAALYCTGRSLSCYAQRWLH